MIKVNNPNEEIWYQKYRPLVISECILPKELKDTFTNFIQRGDTINLILSGNAGVGKTTTAKALLNELGFDSYFVNASIKGNIDTLRNEIMEYASTVSFGKGRKFVILDEADRLTTATQEALRGFMEEFSSNCGFILTCNYLNKIIPPLQSRCSTIDFRFPKSEVPDLMKQMIRVCAEILKNEKIEFDIKAVAILVKNLFPNMRKILTELQRNSHSGRIDSSVVSNLRDENFESICGILKSKDWPQMRKWVAENSDIDWPTIVTRLYQIFDTKVQDESKPQCIITLAEYDYKQGFVTNYEIHLTAMFTELMSNVVFR